MDAAEIVALYDNEQRKKLRYRYTLRDVWPHLVRHVDHSHHDGIVLYTQLDSQNADAVIAEQIAYFGSMGYAFEWKVFEHDQPADLRQRLAAQGFTVEGAESLMVLEIAQAPEALWTPITHDIRRVTQPDELAWVQTVEENVWGVNVDTWIDRLRQDLLEEGDSVQIYVAFADGQPVSCAWMDFRSTNFVGLWGGSTLAEYRGRGFYMALVATRLQAAQKLGAQFLHVDASEMSRPILEKLGFQRLSVSYPCRWTPPSKDGESAEAGA